MNPLRAEIAGLFPDSVSGWEITDPARAEPLFPEEEAAVARAVDKRRQEFALGRTAARRALSALGLPPAPLLPQRDRSVDWPAHVWGSITHADGLCAAVAAPRAAVAGLGIDAELKSRVHERLWSLVATANEIAWLKEPADTGDALLRAALLFSAKEAFYKAQFCVTRAWVGFQDAEIALDWTGTFELTLLTSVADVFARGARFTGRFTVLDEHVVTGMALSPR